MRPGSLLAFAAVLASALLVALFGPGNAKAWNLSAQDTSFGSPSSITAAPSRGSPAAS